jgi:tetratricopeptide (TPR) repeat protein
VRDIFDASRDAARETSPEQALHKTREHWRASFTEIAEDAQRMRQLLGEALAPAGSAQEFNGERDAFAELVAAGERAVSQIRSVIDHVDHLRDEWSAAHRYTAEALEALTDQLDAKLAEEGPGGAQAWLGELLDAADARDEEAAATIATGDLAWPEALRAGAARLGEAFQGWREDGPLPALEPIEEVAEATLEGWKEVLTPRLRSRAHRFAAWTVLRRRGDTARAADHMDAAVELYPYAGRMHAERAAFRLSLGDFERAVSDAQHAIEVTPYEPWGDLVLGIWAELTGKFSIADDLYRRGFKRMPTPDVARMNDRSALIDPPGRLLKMAAAVLLERARPEQALELAKEALLTGVRGLEAHPEADVYVIRRKALEQLPDHPRSEAAEAAVQAGRLCLWNGDVDCAIDELDHATKLGGPPEAGWLRADALLTKSFPLGATTPDQELVAQAHSIWERTAEKGGLPHGPSSWAYVTRAIVADLESQLPDTDRRRPGLFEALLYMEKALVHNHTDAQRWGYVAQFLRYLGLEQLAFEAAEAGYSLSAADRQVLAERLPLLANRRAFDEAEFVAEQLVAMYGEDPWVSAVRAWLALHYRHDAERTLALLQLPIAEGNDKAWYFELQALAHLLTGRLEAARNAYASVLQSEAIDGNTKCRFARASVALSKPGDARVWLAKAENDSTTPQASYIMTAAIQAVAEGDLEVAVRRLDEAIRLAASVVEVDDVVFETTLAMRVVEADGEEAVVDRERKLLEATNEIVAERKAELERDPLTADAELERALARLTEGQLDVPAVALFALAARRDAAAGRHEAAWRRYEQLHGTEFEPEATIAFERELQLVPEAST